MNYGLVVRGVVSVSLALAIAFPASAGMLAGNEDAMPGWTGSTDFDFDGLPKEDTNLEGYVDFAVFGPENVPSFGDYEPTEGELVYAYQVFAEGTDDVSAFVLTLNGVADNIGSSSDSGLVSPSAAAFIPTGEPGGSAQWDFNSPGISPGQSSYLLLFSSPQLPENFAGLTIDGGTNAMVIPVPTPGSKSIPEPSTLTMMVCGLIAAGCIGRRNR